jgi:aspartyl-tRNA(Asn)/glutamyl-tRNA(Gln) amidotransferase subunit A
MSDRSVLDLSIREVGAGYRDGSWTPVAVTEAALSRIGATEPLLHAWAAIDAERALEAAAVAQRELAAGMDRGPLHGIPVGVKDIFDVAGLPTRCGSAARADALPAMEDAVAVGAWRQAGAVILGKTTTQEFAAGVVSPPARNPWDPTRIPGGSSGGSAAAAAVGACFGALGSDTGGSIRIPAAACGVAGFKPAFGRLSVEGVYPLSWSLDTIGPLARTVADTRLLWDALRGDVRFVAGDGTPGSDGPFRVGVSRPYFWDGLQSDVRSAVDAALATMQEAGIAVVAVDWPLAAAARAGAFLINRVETAAVHERVAREEPERCAQ